MSYKRKVNEQRIGKGVEAVTALLRHMPGRTEKNHFRTVSESQDLNPGTKQEC
jgi:hypothetical protein